METGSDSPMPSRKEQDAYTEATTLRRMVIAAMVCVLALVATIVGFSLEEHGTWPFKDEAPATRIVLD